MGRLIDANDLMQVVEESMRDNPHTESAVRRNHGTEHRHFMHLISTQPTAYYDVEEIIKTTRELLAMEWVESDKVQRALGMSFAECFAMFDFARVAEWWSVVGKTPEERARNGQKVTILFRIKGGGKEEK